MNNLININKPNIIFDHYKPNGSNIFIFGSYIELILFFQNNGSLNASAINVTVTTDDIYIEMIENTSIISYAIINEIASIKEPIKFNIREGVPDNHTVEFNIELNSGDYYNNLQFNIVCQAPVFEILNPTLSTDNNIWLPNEVATINVELANTGSAGYGWYPGAEITTTNPNIEIISQEGNNIFYGIDANTSYKGTFLVKANNSINKGSYVEFNISWGYSYIAPCKDDDCIQQANLPYYAIIGEFKWHLVNWELIGLSGNVNNNYYNNLFPGLFISSPITFNKNGYEYEDSLVIGKGYWVKKLCDYKPSTILINKLDLELREGWNMISGLSNDIIVFPKEERMNIYDPNNNIINNSLYKFNDKGYEKENIINPGKGYWIKCNNNCFVTIYI